MDIFYICMLYCKCMTLKISEQNHVILYIYTCIYIMYIMLYLRYMSKYKILCDYIYLYYVYYVVFEAYVVYVQYSAWFYLWFVHYVVFGEHVFKVKETVILFILCTLCCISGACLWRWGYKILCDYIYIVYVMLYPFWMDFPQRHVLPVGDEKCAGK